MLIHSLAGSFVRIVNRFERTVVREISYPRFEHQVIGIQPCDYFQADSMAFILIRASKSLGILNLKNDSILVLHEC